MKKNTKNGKMKEAARCKSESYDFAKKFADFEELQSDYELTEEHLTTKIIMRKIGETLEGYVKILVQILQPEEFPSLYECAVFDDSEKNRIFVLFKDMMITHRELLKAEVLNEEKNSIATINYVHQEIKSHKQEILGIITKMQDSWKKDDKQGKLRYFG